MKVSRWTDVANKVGKNMKSVLQRWDMRPTYSTPERTFTYVPKAQEYNVHYLNSGSHFTGYSL